jgi:AraC family transcriptional regulator
MVKKTVNNEYIYRINSAIDYIEANLDTELSLDKVSEIANFSPFHFHRIFSALTNETINSFITRKRIEKISSSLLRGTDESISELAFRYGFNSQAAFARSFKKFYGISATEFIKRSNRFSKICKTDSNNGKKEPVFDNYICNVNNLLNWIKMNAKVEVKEMPELNLAYIRHVGEFHLIGKVYEELFRWAGPKGLLNFPQTKTVTVYHDDPGVTAIEKVRQSAAITVPEGTKTDKNVGTLKVPDGKYAVGRFEVDENGFEKAWSGMCVWIAENGYTATDGYHYELYHNDHTTHPERKFILDICIPVQ